MKPPSWERWTTKQRALPGRPRGHHSRHGPMVHRVCRQVLPANHVQLVALLIHGSRVTRVAVFDLEAGRWFPMDLEEPDKGEAQPAYVGHGGTAYDLGRHVYTFNAKPKNGII